jgi:hypothetical protein
VTECRIRRIEGGWRIYSLVDALGEGILRIPGDKAVPCARGVARNAVGNLAFGLDGSARLPSGRSRPRVDQRVVYTAGLQHLNDRVCDLFHRVVKSASHRLKVF